MKMMMMRRRRRLKEVSQVVLAVSGEEVGVVPVNEVGGGVIVLRSLSLSVRSHGKSPGTAVVFVRGTLQQKYFRKKYLN